MKKLLIAFWGVLFVFPAFCADVYFHVEPENLKTVASAYFDTASDPNVVAKIADEYLAQLQSNNNQGVTVAGMQAVCAAGGLDITTQSGQQQCIDFVTTLSTLSDTNFYHVCDDDEYEKIPESVRNISKCEKDFFTSTKAVLSNAIALAQEYARIKWNDNIVCSSQVRQHRSDDWISCKSIKTGAFYEFRFDRTDASNDVNIMRDTHKAICEMYGGEYQAGWGCLIDKSECTNINNTCNKFACEAKPGDYKPVAGTGNMLTAAMFQFMVNPDPVPGCEIIDKGIINNEQLQMSNVCSIDPFTFCKVGTQVNRAPASDFELRKYIAEQCKTDISQITCDAGYGIYKGAGEGACQRTVSNLYDVVVSCYYQGNKIDIVFDDLSEAWNTTSRGGLQSMMCVTADGVFDGKNCTFVEEDECNALKAQNATVCPECRDVDWDDKNNLCVLGSAKAATNLQNGIKIAGVVVTVVAAAVATAATGGAASGTWVVVANAATGLGGTAVIASEAAMTYGKFDPFVKRAQECFVNNDAKCAEELVVDELNTMIGYKEEFTPAQQNGLDEILARLVEMIPDDSEFWDEFFGNPEFFDCNDDGTDCAPKERAQFWQVVRTVGDVSMIIGGILSAIKIVSPATTTTVTTTTTSTKTEAAIYNRIQRIGINERLGGGKNPGRVVTRGLGGDNKTILANNLRNVNVTADVNSDVVATVEKIVGANDFVPKNISRNTQFLQWLRQNSQYKFVDPKTGKLFTQAEFDDIAKSLAQTVTTTTTTVTPGAASVTLSALGLVPIGVGAGNLVYHEMEESDTLILSRDGEEEFEAPEPGDPEFIGPIPVPVPVPIDTSAEDPEPAPVVATEEEFEAPEPGDPEFIGPIPVPVPTPAPVVTTAAPEKPNVTIDLSDLPDATPHVDETEIQITNNPLSVDKYTYTPSAPAPVKSEPVTPYQVEKPNNTGLIATAAILGAIGTGVLVGALVGGDDDDDDDTHGEEYNQLEQDLTTILNVAGGTIGYVGNHSITLAKMQTMVGSYVQIVNIAGNAVVVVIYNGHYLPYYLNPGVGQWIPVLGISSVGGYMNTYPQNPTGISVVDSIAGILNQKLPGRLVGQFVGANSAGVQFPTPAPAAYQTINAEFPNGVVQSATEMQSQTGQQLYNNNYNRIKNIFITAHLGGFFIDYFIL